MSSQSGPKVGQSGQDSDWPAARVGWYATFILTLAYTFSFIDRQILNLLVEPIKHDLQLTDTSISFLQGLAFVIPYVAMSVPIGRLVDKFNRIFVLMGGVLVWSITTFACGMSNSYSQLLIARMGVGAGEASVTPAAWSLLADYFSPEKLARPVSVYLMGPYLGGGLALIGGAYVIDWVGNTGSIDVPFLGQLATWQFTFMAVALPGILIVAILATLPNPPRRQSSSTDVVAPPWSEVWAYVVSEKRIYLAVLLGVPFLIVILYGLQGWTPTILVRVFGWTLSEAGRIYGTLALIAGSLGVLSGPILGNWLAKRGYADYPLRIGVFASIAIVLSIGSLPWQTTGVGALVCIGFASYFVTLPLALMTYVTQMVSPSNMRGVMSGVYVVGTNVIGLGLGPTLVGGTTDFILADPNKVHISLTIVSVVVAPIAMLLLMSGMRALGQWQTANLENANDQK